MGKGQGKNISKARIKKTDRQKFLEMMDSYVPWKDWLTLIDPYYYPQGRRGRKSYPLEVMLRIFLLQVWFSISDKKMEDALYENRCISAFAHLQPGETPIPDETTILRFRHILEKQELCKHMFTKLSEILDEHGIIMRGGTIVDATIIEAPSSTKNQKGERDPEMHQTKKGNQWHFGFKAHTGVDAGSGLVHSVEITSANISDIEVTKKLIRNDDNVVYGDSGYRGIWKRPEITGDKTKMGINWRINRRKGSVHNDWERLIERQKSSVRSKVEHPFQIIKKVFGFEKTTYRGIAKNGSRLFALFASANVLMCARAGRCLV